MDSPQYDAWLVDLDGTLYRARWLKMVMAIDLAIHPSSIRVIRRFRIAHERLRSEAFDSSSVSPFDEQISRTSVDTGVPEERVRSIVNSWMIEKPCRWLRMFRREELIEQLVDYRAIGGKTALVSDYPARRKLVALGADSFFDVVVASGEPDGPTSLKPSPSGLLLAAQKLGVSPSRCLVIGDRVDADGLAARRASMAFRLVR